MSCPTTITPAPIPGIGDTRVVTLHGLADAAAIIREHAEMARQLSELQTDSIWQTADEMRDRAAWAVQSAIKLLTDRDEVLADAVQSARLQADMIDRMKADLEKERAELAQQETAAEDCRRLLMQARIILRGPHTEKNILVRELIARIDAHGVSAAAPSPAAEPEQAEPDHTEDALGMVCSCGPVSASLPTGRTVYGATACRCGPDGCSDSVACPKGGAA